MQGQVHRFSFGVDRNDNFESRTLLICRVGVAQYYNHLLHAIMKCYGKQSMPVLLMTKCLVDAPLQQKMGCLISAH